MKSSGAERNASGSSQMKELSAAVWCDHARLFRGLDKRETLSLGTNGKNQKKPKKADPI
jgi:hypothetical protein